MKYDYGNQDQDMVYKVRSNKFWESKLSFFRPRVISVISVYKYVKTLCVSEL